MKNFLFLFLFSFVSTASGIRFFDDSTDQECQDLGKRFPSVGYFSDEDGIPFGSGVLIGTHNPHLNGRIVMTAAHVLDNKSEDLYFNIGGKKLVGDITIHPKYEKTSEDALGSKNDIAFFFLERAIMNIPLATLNLDISFNDIVQKRYFSLCGFGMSGPLNGSSEQPDTRRRACYSYASDSLNAQDKSLDGSLIALSPDCILTPAGLSDSGDSGGGMFLAEGGDLAGIIITGSSIKQNGKLIQVNQRSVLLSFHKEWILGGLEKFASENWISNLILPVFPSAWGSPRSLIGKRTEGQRGSFVVKLRRTERNTSFNEEFSFDEGLRFSKNSILQAINARINWKFANNRNISKENSVIRYGSALNLFESSNSVIKEMGFKSLLLLAKDDGVSDSFRCAVAKELFTSEKKNLGAEAYRAIMNDNTVSAESRIDAAYVLLDNTNCKVECWNIIETLLPLSLHDKRHKYDSVLNTIFYFGKHKNPMIRDVALAYFFSLQKISDDHHGVDGYVPTKFSWNIIFKSFLDCL